MQQTQTLNLIPCIITFSTKHAISKTSLCLNWCLIKVKVKPLQVCINQICDSCSSYFQVINNPYQLQLHLLVVGSFTDNHFHIHLFKQMLPIMLPYQGNEGSNLQKSVKKINKNVSKLLPEHKKTSNHFHRQKT